MFSERRATRRVFGKQNFCRTSAGPNCKFAPLLSEPWWEPLQVFSRSLILLVLWPLTASLWQCRQRARTKPMVLKKKTLIRLSLPPRCPAAAQATETGLNLHLRWCLENAQATVEESLEAVACHRQRLVCNKSIMQWEIIDPCIWLLACWFDISRCRQWKTQTHYESQEHSSQSLIYFKVSPHYLESHCLHRGWANYDLGTKMWPIKFFDPARWIWRNYF